MERHHANLFFAYVYFLVSPWCGFNAWGRVAHLTSLVCSRRRVRRRAGRWCPLRLWKALKGLGVASFSSANRDILGKGYTILDAFTDLMPLFISHQQVEGMGLPCNALCCSLAELHNSWVTRSAERRTYRPRTLGSPETRSSTINRSWRTSDCKIRAWHCSPQPKNC